MMFQRQFNNRVALSSCNRPVITLQNADRPHLKNCTIDFLNIRLKLFVNPPRWIIAVKNNGRDRGMGNHRLYLDQFTTRKLRSFFFFCLA